MRGCSRSKIWPSSAASAAWATDAVATGLAAVDALVARHGGGGLCVAAAGGVTAAECVVVPAALAAGRFGVAYADYPHVAGVVERCGGMDAFVKAAPAACPDAE